ncbi:MAG TPA: hypothetical protein VGO86_18045 [Candidatus Dormibacteraeota bacterium]
MQTDLPSGWPAELVLRPRLRGGIGARLATVPIVTLIGLGALGLRLVVRPGGDQRLTLALSGIVVGALLVVVVLPLAMWMRGRQRVVVSLGQLLYVPDVGAARRSPLSAVRRIVIVRVLPPSGSRGVREAPTVERMLLLDEHDRCLAVLATRLHDQAELDALVAATGAPVEDGPALTMRAADLFARYPGSVSRIEAHPNRYVVPVILALIALVTVAVLVVQGRVSG